MKTHYYCTLFDRNYLAKGLVMLQTLLRHCPEAKVFVLCMDEETKSILSSLDLPGVSLLTLNEVEDEDLLRVKTGRTIAEYCWTLSAATCWYVICHFEQVDRLTYLDADLMFFSSVEPLFDEIGDKSISIIEHRFSERFQHLEAYGRFNVEWVTFVRDEHGLRCLKKWRDQCIDWCFARLEDGRMGDQKYLDHWPSDFNGYIHILEHPGAGIAPWNFSNYNYPIVNDVFFVNDSPLIFYHFHQFQLLSGNSYDYMSETYSRGFSIPVHIYKAYEYELEKSLKQIRIHIPKFNGGIRSGGKIFVRRLAQQFLPISIKNFLRKYKVQMW